MVVADHGVWRVAEQAVITVGAALIALVPILVSLHRKADKTYRHINSIEEYESVDGAEGQTLGQLVRDGFARNDETHHALMQTVEPQSEIRLAAAAGGHGAV